jgi:hypothetical protein
LLVGVLALALAASSALAGCGGTSQAAKTHEAGAERALRHLEADSKRGDHRGVSYWSTRVKAEAQRAQEAAEHSGSASSVGSVLSWAAKILLLIGALG